MKNFVFEKNENGMRKYFQSIPKIRSIIHNYLSCECADFKEYIRDEYNEANALYKNYLIFRSLITEEMKTYVEQVMHHHVCHYNFDLGKLFTHWVLIVYHPMHLYVEEVDIKEIGKLIQIAREDKGMSRLEVANIVGINFRSVEAYEKGERVIPLDIYFKIKQFLKIKLF